MNKLYSVHDHWTDINKKNDVDIESIDGVITGIKVNGEDYGGGSSDFSTVNIDVTVNLDELFYLTNAVGIVGEKMRWIESFVTGTYTLVLYKGEFENNVRAPEGYHIVSVTGTDGVTVSEGMLGRKFVHITGDGALTVELASN